MAPEAPFNHLLAEAPPADFAGPFLRYQNVLPGSTAWAGSVLFLTRSAAGASGGSGTAGGGPSAGPPACSSYEKPELLLEDAHVQGTAAASAGGAGPVSCGPPTLLDSCLGWQFWRFELQLELGRHQRPVKYWLRWGGPGEGSGGGGGSGSGGECSAGGSNADADGGSRTTQRFQFWLPAVGQSFHCAYFSCNGFTDDTPPDAPERSDPLYMWRDLLGVHSAFPMHVLIGGGDQVYSDEVWATPALKAWTHLPSRSEKLVHPWSSELQHDATAFYLHNYINVFMGGEVRLALASIPSVMMWDDHDIYDGFGSYSDDIQGCPVVQGVFSVAKRFYLLFQHHTTQELNLQRQELFGAGEYHFLKSLGPEVTLLGIDMRSKRCKKAIMPQSSYQVLEEAVMGLPEGVRHLIVMSGVPVVFPRLPLAEQMLEFVAALTKSSRMIRRVGQKLGVMDPTVGTQPEILDDLIDGWAAVAHSEERVKFIHMLQRIAVGKGYRVTILSGDAHVGAVGRLYSRPKVKDLSLDPLFMPQIISSAIVNGPPPHPVVRMLVRTNFANNVDGRSREKLVRLYLKKWPKLHKLLPARNWCDISLMKQPLAPPMHPSDARYGSLRFSLRCEDATSRGGQAADIYNIYVPQLLAWREAGVSPTGTNTTE